MSGCVFRVAAVVAVLAYRATGQVSILQLQMVQGEGMVHVPGSRTRQPIVVAVSDENGRPVPGATVSFHLPDAGPSGLFASGLRTDIAITGPDGRAAIRGLRANRTTGRFQLRIVAAKEHARAGMVSMQYVGEVRSGGPPGKWLVLAALAAGGAAGGLLATHGSTPAPPASVVVPPAPTLTIGTPSISVGKP